MRISIVRNLKYSATQDKTGYWLLLSLCLFVFSSSSLSSSNAAAEKGCPKENIWIKMMIYTAPDLIFSIQVYHLTRRWHHWEVTWSAHLCQVRLSLVTSTHNKHCHHNTSTVNRAQMDRVTEHQSTPRCSDYHLYRVSLKIYCYQTSHPFITWLWSNSCKIHF